MRTVGVIPNITAVELCVLEDLWISYVLEGQPSPETPQLSVPPMNLQLYSFEDRLVLSWQEPLTTEETTGYRVVCSTNMQYGSNSTLLTLSCTVEDTSALISLTGLDVSTYFNCCVTAQYRGASSTPTCEIGTVQTAAPTTSTLVPTLQLSILAAMFFLISLVVSIILVLICSNIILNMRERKKLLHTAKPE